MLAVGISRYDPDPLALASRLTVRRARCTGPCGGCWPLASDPDQLGHVTRAERDLILRNMQPSVFVGRPTSNLPMSAFSCDVRFWPKADIPSCTAHVGFRGQSGHVSRGIPFFATSLAMTFLAVIVFW